MEHLPTTRNQAFEDFLTQVDGDLDSFFALLDTMPIERRQKCREHVLVIVGFLADADKESAKAYLQLLFEKVVSEKNISEMN
jgi:hypothetical protein